jgi:hypothetical protein
VSCSVIFAISSPYLKSNKESRSQIFYASYNKLSNSNELTLISEMPYVQGNSKEIVKDTISCKIEGSNYSCSMISELKANNELIRTSYFPGDGFKYSKTKDNVKTKEVYENSKLVSYFNSLLGGISTYLSFLTLDNNSIKSSNVIYEPKVTFSFDKFRLERSLDISYGNDNARQQLRLNFNNKNHIEGVNLINNNASIQINYEKTIFSFPSFSSYVQI